MADNSVLPSGSIAVIAKCPIPQKSKTRLMPLLGEEGSVQLARAMLSDILVTLDECSTLRKVRKHLFYAPATEEGFEIMKSILDELNLTKKEDDSSGSNDDGWHLLPLLSKNLNSTDLGSLLQDVLVRIQKDKDAVVFLGMDSPELPLDEIVTALQNLKSARLCPTDDGGYGMLSIPPLSPKDKVFSGIRWSCSLTAVSQLKALTDSNIPVVLGRLMHDIDEPEDVKALCQRLLNKTSSDTTNDVLTNVSTLSMAPAAVDQCRYTRQALVQLGQLQETSEIPM